MSDKKKPGKRGPWLWLVPLVLVAGAIFAVWYLKLLPDSILKMTGALPQKTAGPPPPTYTPPPAPNTVNGHSVPLPQVGGLEIGASRLAFFESTQLNLLIEDPAAVHVLFGTDCGAVAPKPDAPGIATYIPCATSGVHTIWATIYNQPFTRSRRVTLAVEVGRAISPKFPGAPFENGVVLTDFEKNALELFYLVPKAAVEEALQTLQQKDLPMVKVARTIRVLERQTSVATVLGRAETIQIIQVAMTQISSSLAQLNAHSNKPPGDYLPVNWDGIWAQAIADQIPSDTGKPPLPAGELIDWLGTTLDSAAQHISPTTTSIQLTQAVDYLHGLMNLSLEIKENLTKFLSGQMGDVLTQLRLLNASFNEPVQGNKIVTASSNGPFMTEKLPLCATGGALFLLPHFSDLVQSRCGLLLWNVNKKKWQNITKLFPPMSVQQLLVEMTRRYAALHAVDIPMPTPSLLLEKFDDATRQPAMPISKTQMAANKAADSDNEAAPVKSFSIHIKNNYLKVDRRGKTPFEISITNELDRAQQLRVEADISDGVPVLWTISALPDSIRLSKGETRKLPITVIPRSASYAHRITLKLTITGRGETEGDQTKFRQSVALTALNDQYEGIPGPTVMPPLFQFGQLSTIRPVSIETALSVVDTRLEKLANIQQQQDTAVVVARRQLDELGRFFKKSKARGTRKKLFKLLADSWYAALSDLMEKCATTGWSNQNPNHHQAILALEGLSEPGRGGNKMKLDDANGGPLVSLLQDIYYRRLEQQILRQLRTLLLRATSGKLTSAQLVELRDSYEKRKGRQNGDPGRYKEASNALPIETKIYQLLEQTITDKGGSDQQQEGATVLTVAPLPEDPLPEAVDHLFDSTPPQNQVTKATGDGL